MRKDRKLVYFLKPIGMDGPIKIGCSVLPEKRLKTLDIVSPFKLELIASAPGGHPHEKKLHYRFAANRRHGEWFDATPELLALIAEIAATGELPPMVEPKTPDQWKVHHAEGAGKMPPRDPAGRLVKFRITKTVNEHERAVHGVYDAKSKRPARIAAIIDGYQGFHAGPPTDEQIQEINQYIARLKAELPTGKTPARIWRDRWFADNCAHARLISQAAA